MGTDLTSNQAFDEYAARFGWAYDNGQRYGDECWDRYEGHPMGIVLLRHANDRVCVVRFEGPRPVEIWSGALRTSDDFDLMVSSVARRIETI